jgi:hypothetical protein
VVHFHPDRFARYASPAVSLIAQEVFIHINKAYDRMRDAAVAAGEAISAGPALLPHRGWLAGFEDIGAIPSRHSPTSESSAVARLSTPPIAAAARPRAPAGVVERPSPSPAPRAPTVPGSASVSFSRPAASVAAPTPAPAPAPAIEAVPLNEASLFEGLEEDAGAAPLLGGPSTAPIDTAGAQREIARLIDESRLDLDSGNYQTARDRLVQALQHAPRDRAARSLYHVAQAYLLNAEGKAVEATSQLEAALAHDPASAEARRAIDGLRREHDKKGPQGGGLFRRLFNK